MSGSDRPGECRRVSALNVYQHTAQHQHVMTSNSVMTRPGPDDAGGLSMTPSGPDDAGLFIHRAPGRLGELRQLTGLSVVRYDRMVTE